MVVGWAVNPRGFPKCFFGAGQEAQANNELGSFLCPGVPDGRVRAFALLISAIFTDSLPAQLWSKVWFRETEAEARKLA